MNKALAVLLALLWLPLAPCSYGADAKVELQDLIGKVKTKLQAGKTSEADFTDELKSFDALLAEHQGEKNNDVATILFMKATLYAEVFENEAKATESLQKLKADFPDTAPAKQADGFLAALAKQHAANEVQERLIVGASFPDFHETDLDGKPLSVSNYKGKIVLVDFWATWCGPCVEELPNVLKVYHQYHDKGLEVIGVSLDEDKAKLTGFLQEKQVPWPQYFDGKGGDNKLANAYGVETIPTTYLLGRDGKIIGKGLRGDDLESAVSAALAPK